MSSVPPLEWSMINLIFKINNKYLSFFFNLQTTVPLYLFRLVHYIVNYIRTYDCTLLIKKPGKVMPGHAMIFPYVVKTRRYVFSSRFFNTHTYLGLVSISQLLLQTCTVLFAIICSAYN